MLLTLNQTDRDKERAACKKAETITYGIFDSFADAKRTSTMLTYATAYFKDNPDALKEPLFLEKNFKVGDES